MEIFVDPLFGALGAFLFIFLLTTLMIGIAGIQPTILTERLPDASAGEPYEVWLSAEGGAGQYDWHLPPEESLPKGLTLDHNGHLHGTVEPVDAAADAVDVQFEVEVEALNMEADKPELTRSRRQYAMKIFTDGPIIPSTLPPVKIVTEPKLPEAITGRPYSFSLAAIGGLPPYTWTSGELPKGLKLAADTGIISGQPAAPTEAPLELTVHVADGRRGTSAGREDEEIVSLVIIPPPGPPAPPIRIATTELPPAVETRDYRLTLAAVGGLPPYEWSAKGLPDWAKIDAQSGLIAGTPPPQSRGVFKVEIGLRDAERKTAPLPLRAEWTVLTSGVSAADPLQLIEFDLPTARAGRAYEVAIATKGGALPLQFTAADEPPGLKVDRTTGILQGTPAVAGRYAFQVLARDSSPSPMRDTYEYVLTIEEASPTLAAAATVDPVKLVKFNLPQASAGAPYEVAFATRGGVAPLTFTASDLPAGLALDRLTGIIRGTPASAGSKSISVTVRDSSPSPQRDTQDFELAVTAAVRQTPLLARERREQPATQADQPQDPKAVGRWFALLAVMGVHWFLIAAINKSAQQRMAKYFWG